MFNENRYQRDILLSELSKQLPDKPGYKALWRWAKVGIRSQSGKLIKLPWVKLTGGAGSSLAKYDQFIDELQS